MVLADSFYYQPVQIDTINTRVNADLFAKEGDANGRGMVVQITENGIIKDTTGITLRLQWSHVSVVVSGFTDFEVVDATKGLYKVKYPTSMLHRGRVEAFIRITDNGILSGTRNLMITVERMVGSDETIEASDDFSALQTALTKLSAWEETISGKVDTWESDMEATKQLYIDTLTAAEAAYPQELVALGSQLAETNAIADTAALKADAMASGSPKGVYATLSALQSAFPTGTTGAYLVTTDGKWYYWSGSAWAIGGVYQAVGIGDGTIRKQKLNPMIQSLLVDGYETLQVTLTPGGYIQYQTGELVVAESAYKYSDAISVVEGEKFKISAVSAWSSNIYTILNASGNVITSYPNNGSTNLHYIDHEFTIPQGAATMRCNTFGNKIFRLQKVTSFNLNGKNLILNNQSVTKSKLEAGIQSLLSDEYTDFEVAWNTPGYYNYNNGMLVAQNTGFYYANVISVSEGDKFIIKNAYSNFASNVYIVTDANGVKLTAFPNQSGLMKAYETVELTIPPGGTRLLLNKSGGYNTTVKKATGNLLNADKLDTPIPTGIFDGKKLLFTGDSICYGANWRPSPETWDTTGWRRVIKETNPLALTYGYGSGGWRIARAVGDEKTILNKIDLMLTDHADADYIIIQGGVNDAWATSVTQGVITSGFNDVYDEYTFCGALESIFRKSLLGWKGKKIGFITTHKIPSAQPKMETYMTLAKQICEKWGVPCLDLYHEIGTNVALPDINTLYMQNADYTHPNEAFYRAYYAPKIEAWMKLL